MSKRTVKMMLEVPKGIVDFASDFLKFRAEDQPVKEFLADELVESVMSILTDLPRTWFDGEKILKKYRLPEGK